MFSEDAIVAVVVRELYIQALLLTKLIGCEQSPSHRYEDREFRVLSF